MLIITHEIKKKEFTREACKIDGFSFLFRLYSYEKYAISYFSRKTYKNISTIFTNRDYINIYTYIYVHNVAYKICRSTSFDRSFVDILVYRFFGNIFESFPKRYSAFLRINDSVHGMFGARQAVKHRSRD